MAPVINKSVGVWKSTICASSETTGPSAMSNLLSSDQPKMFPSYQTFFTPTYQEDFGQKTAQRVQCIRTGSSSGNRRNNPHPPHVSKASRHFMGCIWYSCTFDCVHSLSSIRPLWCGGIHESSFSLITSLMTLLLPSLPLTWLAPTLTLPPHTK